MDANQLNIELMGQRSINSQLQQRITLYIQNETNLRTSIHIAQMESQRLKSELDIRTGELSRLKDSNARMTSQLPKDVKELHSEIELLRAQNASLAAKVASFQRKEQEAQAQVKKAEEAQALIKQAEQDATPIKNAVPEPVSTTAAQSPVQVKSNLFDYLFGGRIRFAVSMISVLAVLYMMRMSNLWTPTDMYSNPWKHGSEVLMLIGSAGVALTVAWLQGGFLKNAHKDNVDQRVNRFAMSAVFCATLALGLWLMNILRPRTNDSLDALTVVAAAACFFLFFKSVILGLVKSPGHRSVWLFLVYWLMTMGSIAFLLYLVIAFTSKTADKGLWEIWQMALFISPVTLLVVKLVPQAFKLEGVND